jgi:hypothetical protein
VAPTNDIIKEKADEHPGHVVKRGCRRQVARASENEREVDIFEEADPELLVQSPLYQRCKRAGQEEEDEAVVELTVREQTLWSNDTPLKHRQQELSNGNQKVCSNTTKLTTIDAVPNTVVDGQMKPSF